MLRFLFRLTVWALLLGIAALTGFVCGRSDQSESIALNSVSDVCGLADTSLGRHYLKQDQVDNAVQNLAALFQLTAAERAHLASKAVATRVDTPCLAALAQLEPRGPRVLTQPRPKIRA
jgi:hypothetical protein